MIFIGYGSASQKLSFNFFLPANWRLTDAAYLELSFRHSQLMDFKGSSLNVLLGSFPLASISLDEESALGDVLHVKLPASATLPGKINRLTVRAVMIPLDVCLDNSTNLWLTVSRDSRLHLDHQEEPFRRPYGFGMAHQKIHRQKCCIPVY